MVKQELKIQRIEPIKLGRTLRPESALRHSHFFMCPGCGYAHCFTDTTQGYNGKPSYPTLDKEVFISGHIALFKCRSKIINGTIHFSEDCSHEHAGQTYQLPTV